MGSRQAEGEPALRSSHRDLIAVHELLRATSARAFVPALDCGVRFAR